VSCIAFFFSSSPTSRMAEWLTWCIGWDRKGFDSRLMRDVKLIDAGPEGVVTWELTITPAYANLNSETSEGSCFDTRDL
jgi:hypothetical protein